jgi:hypothetical protein
MDQAIKTAQAIIDSVTDIRPVLTGKVVVGVESGQYRLTARVRFSDGSEVRFAGLYAKQILRHLPPLTVV